jgi:hypothetical protein
VSAEASTRQFGKEGPRAAVAEMTKSKTIILHGRAW